MRISDWSSDVCSSDLHADHDQAASGGECLYVVGQIARAHVVEDDVGAAGVLEHLDEGLLAIVDSSARAQVGTDGQLLRGSGGGEHFGAERTGELDRERADPAGAPVHQEPLARFERSEEHTSELQTLMRIVYAVFR